MSKILTFVIVSLLLLSCTSTGDGYMQQKELLAQIEKGVTPIIIDVRSGSEYQLGHIPGAIHIPFWSAFTTDKLDSFEKTKEIVLYCEHGPRAGIAKLGFSLSGFSKVSYLAGHMTAWKKSGFPMSTVAEDIPISSKEEKE